jgi:hypothetical protein
MPFWESQRVFLWKPTHDRWRASRSFAEQVQVRSTADPVANESRHLEVRIEGSEAASESSDAAGHARGVADE